MRLSNNLANRNYDASSVGPGRDVEDELLIDEDDNDRKLVALPIDNGCRIVSKLSLNFIPKKLVEHFHIMWMRNKIVWTGKN